MALTAIGRLVDAIGDNLTPRSDPVVSGFGNSDAIFFAGGTLATSGLASNDGVSTNSPGATDAPGSGAIPTGTSDAITPLDPAANLPYASASPAAPWQAAWYEIAQTAGSGESPGPIATPSPFFAPSAGGLGTIIQPFDASCPIQYTAAGLFGQAMALFASPPLLTSQPTPATLAPTSDLGAGSAVYVGSVLKS